MTAEPPVAWFYMAKDGPQFVWGSEIYHALDPAKIGYLRYEPQNPDQEPFAWRISSRTGHYAARDLTHIDEAFIGPPLFNYDGAGQ